MFDFNDLEQEIQGAAFDLFMASSQAGLLPRLTSGRRTFAQQARLWKNYLRGLSDLPALPPGFSAHEYGVAFDMVTADLSDLADVGYTWETWGGVWGGSSDPVHFEIPGAHGYILRHVSLSAIAASVDIALMFLKGPVGMVTNVASLLQFFPRWAHNSVLDAISSPGSTILEALRARGFVA